MKVKNYYFGIILLVFFACNVNKRTTVFLSDNEKSLIEQEYYRNFINGVKEEINGNYMKAIALYNDCINKFPERAAPYYQLSNLYLKAQNVEKAKELAIKAESLNQKNIWYKLHLANIYQFKNETDSAISIYERIIKIDQNPEYVYNLALLYSQANREAESVKMLDLLEKEYNGSKEIFLLKHNLFNNLKNFDSAVFELKELTKNFPDEINNYGMLAEYLGEIGRSDEAREIYKYALVKDSTNGIVLLSFGDFYLKKNQNDSAFYFYKKAFNSNTLDFDTKINIIVNFLKNKEFTESNKASIEVLLAILRKGNADFMIHAVYADFYSNLQDYEKSVKYMDSAIIIKKDNYFLWEQSILISNYLKNYQDVIKKVSECSVYFPEKDNILLIKAFAEHSLENEDSAIITANKVIKISKSTEVTVQAYNLLGEIYRNIGKSERSDECFEEILKIDKENLTIRNNYSYYLALRGEKLEHALELSEYTVTRDPKNATYLDTYGWILFKLNKFKESKNYIEAAIRYGAYNNAEVLDHYGEIMIKLEKCKDAVEAWERILEVDSTYSIKDKLESLKTNCK